MILWGDMKMVNELQKVDFQFDRMVKKISDIKDCYTPGIKFFLEYLKDNDIRIISFPVCESYYHYLLNLRLKANSFNFKLASLKCRMKYLLLSNEENINRIYTFEQLMKNLKPIKVSKKIDTGSLPSVETLKYLIQKTRESSLSISLIIQFLLYTGLRVSSLISLRIEDAEIINDHVKIRVRQTKGKNEISVFIEKSLYQDIIAHFKGKEYIFITSQGKLYNRNYLSSRIAYYSKLYLESTFRSHLIRHIFASHAINKGKWSLKKLSVQLGHANTSVTAMYQHDNPKYEDLKKLDLMAK